MEKICFHGFTVTQDCSYGAITISDGCYSTTVEKCNIVRGVTPCGMQYIPEPLAAIEAYQRAFGKLAKYDAELAEKEAIEAEKRKKVFEALTERNKLMRMLEEADKRYRQLDRELLDASKETNRSKALKIEQSRVVDDAFDKADKACREELYEYIKRQEYIAELEYQRRLRFCDDDDVAVF